MRLHLFLLMLDTVCLPSGASDFNLLTRLADNASTPLSVGDEPFRSPVTRQWRRSYSLTEVTGTYFYNRQSQAIDVREGSGYDGFSFLAATYLKHRTSTLTGHASYSNSHTRSVCWNETSDYQLLYPYISADSIGGDMNSENYSFAGSYADHSGQWSWGGEICYDAGLHYRAVDPRPRNITGMLKIKAGTGYNVGGRESNNIALSLSYQRYKQSGSVTFFNELGSDKIFHLTGPGTHYVRFAGNGYGSIYQGNGIGASVDFVSSTGRGWAASLSASQMSIEQLLTDLNRLPLTRLRISSLSASLLWLHPGQRHDFSASAYASLSRRSGRENIFGDAAAGSYPLIGSADLYSQNNFSASLAGFWRHRTSHGVALWLMPRVALTGNSTLYADPHRKISLTMLSPEITAGLTVNFSQWLLTTRFSFRTFRALDSQWEWTRDQADIVALRQLELRRYDTLRSGSTSFDAGFEAIRTLSARYALSLSLNGHMQCYSHTDISTRGFNASLSLHF